VVGVSLMGAVALAPPLGELLIEIGGFKVLYAAATGAVPLAWAAAAGATRRLSSQPRQSGGMPFHFFPLLKRTSYLIVLGCTLILAHCQSTVVHFIALIAAERGAPSGRFFLVSHLAAVFVLLGVARFIDRYGKQLFLWISYPVLAIGLLCIPSMIPSPLFFVSAILFGVGVGLLFPTVNAMAAEQGRPMDKPVIMSIFTANMTSALCPEPSFPGGWVVSLDLRLLSGSEPGYASWPFS